MKKKLFVVLFLFSLSVGSLFAFTENKSIKDCIPTNVSHIEFWNGGSKIATFDNAKVEIEIKFCNYATWGNECSTSFCIYKITCNGKTVNIVDSDALSIIYVE